jgi:hypothetical protein
VQHYADQGGFDCHWHPGGDASRRRLSREAHNLIRISEPDADMLCFINKNLPLKSPITVALYRASRFASPLTPYLVILYKLVVSSM